jgi:hypothetical protein
VCAYLHIYLAKGLNNDTFSRGRDCSVVGQIGLARRHHRGRDRIDLERRHDLDHVCGDRLPSVVDASPPYIADL